MTLDFGRSSDCSGRKSTATWRRRAAARPPARLRALTMDGWALRTCYVATRQLKRIERLFSDIARRRLAGIPGWGRTCRLSKLSDLSGYFAYLGLAGEALIDKPLEVAVVAYCHGQASCQRELEARVRADSRNSPAWRFAAARADGFTFRLNPLANRTTISSSASIHLELAYLAHRAEPLHMPSHFVRVWPHSVQSWRHTH
jgi:hypothetical protein